MNKKSFKKYEYKSDGFIYLIEEDLVGWYLIAYDVDGGSYQDYLVDSLQEALFEAESRFNIPSSKWVEIVDEV
ncbi:MAG: hypothetical protein JSS61_06025 [Verrucomicrobia bacterium]|nr:hypothetical protein [Verrucomicrobiota bacterium]